MMLVWIICGILCALSFLAFMGSAYMYNDAQQKLWAEARKASNEDLAACIAKLLNRNIETLAGISTSPDFLSADRQCQRTSFWHKAMIASALICIGSLIVIALTLPK